MTEAKITDWLQPEGAWVEKGDALFVLEHEKASLEIESPASGRLRILVPVDQVVPVLTPVAALVGDSEATLDSPGDEVPFARPSRQEFNRSMTGDAGGADGGMLRVSPKARFQARRQGISLQGIVGSGPRGMIVTSDVQALLRSKPVRKASPLAQRVAQEMGVEVAAVSGSGLRGQVMRRDVEKAAPPVAHIGPSPDLAALKGLRGIIASRLSASWAERPQVSLTTEADATFLVAVRHMVEAEWDLKVSYNAFFTLLVSKALREFPYINAQLTPQGIQVMPEINIGLAVETERGLLVPVLHDAGRKSLFEINQELHGLVQRAIEGRSFPDELAGGTFTITNLGMYEIDAFTPIINPPECAILGVGRIVSRPVGLDGQIVLREMVALSLSFDHRLVDGAPAARFLQRVKTLVERCGVMGFDHGH
jgi:pyruvate dehydrogenase E2 component (dihydrolipoamide acetyltransferase)